MKLYGNIFGAQAIDILAAPNVLNKAITFAPTEIHTTIEFAFHKGSRDHAVVILRADIAENGFKGGLKNVCGLLVKNVDCATHGITTVECALGAA